MNGAPKPDGTALVERFRAARRDRSLVVLEGFHALKHALRFGADVLYAVSPDPASVLALAADLAADLQATLPSLLRPVDRRTFERLAPTPHPTGVIALARRREIDVARVLGTDDPSPVVVLDRPTHHGNIGAVIRVAAAAGAAGVLVVGDADPWHPAAVRGAAALQFALPVACVDALPETDRPIVALDPAGEPLTATAIPARTILVFGSERVGISEQLLNRASHRVAIPMKPGVSSLNLATAVAVVLYAERLSS